MSTVSTDPIADMLTRVRNAIAVRKNEVSLPHSKVKESIARLLKDSGFITGVSVEDDVVGKKLVLVIHGANENARITEISRISKPGRREYVKAEKIPVIKRGRGVVIVSTSHGIMTGTQAKKQGVGGELLCKVY